MLAVAVGQGYIARGMWPSGIGYLKSSADLDKDMFQLPRTWDAMAEHLQIEASGTHVGDATRGLVLQVRTATESLPLEIRFWGFVKHCALVATGNWDGKKDGAARAKQYLVLDSRGCNAAFVPQVEAVKHIRDFVFAELGGAKQAPLIDTLYCQHRVFRKARGDERGRTVRYLHGEDPTGMASKVSGDWRLATKPAFQRQEKDGSIIHTSAVTVHPGDFVEVRVVADIVYKQSMGKEANLVRVNFDIASCLRLYSESQLEAMHIPAALALVTRKGKQTAASTSNVAQKTRVDGDEDEEME